MNYENFLNFKNELLKSHPNLINLAENNLYKYRPFPLEYDNTGHINSIVYRCHLVEDWLRFYSLSQDYKKDIGVSNGIRHSISIIADKLKDKIYLIPKDVYPFYQKTLNEKQIIYKEYETLNNKELFSEINNIEADVLLITDPLKPLGRDILEKEYQYIENWLLADKERILLVDGAYMLNNQLNEYLLKLYHETNQVILMYSLSKGWSLPNCLGITIFMKNDFGKSLRESYKLLEKNQNNLNLAYMALNKSLNSLNELKEILYSNHKVVENILNKELPYSKENISYLYYLPDSFEDLLNKNILSIPASVFGGKKGVVISTLYKK